MSILTILCLSVPNSQSLHKSASPHIYLQPYKVYIVSSPNGAITNCGRYYTISTYICVFFLLEKKFVVSNNVIKINYRIFLVRSCNSHLFCNTLCTNSTVFFPTFYICIFEWHICKGMEKFILFI